LLPPESLELLPARMTKLPGGIRFPLKTNTFSRRAPRMELELETKGLTSRPVSRRSLPETSTGRSQSLFGKQRLPKLSLFLPVYDQRQPLELTQVNGVAAPLGPRQKQQGLLNVGG
jgi:hypothetical protein